MPLYEYECAACHKRTEKIQKFSDPEITVCPHCGGELKRVLSAPAFALKGGGWYADGYGSAKPAPAAGEASAPKSDAAAPSTPAAAPATAPAAASTAAATSSSSEK
jgi:putative FmdB family regulatory protein